MTARGIARWRKGLRKGDWDNVQKGLKEAFQRAGKAQQKQIRVLERYLENHWEGIVQLPEAW